MFNTAATCQYAKLFREINYTNKDNGEAALSREEFDALIVQKCDAFIARSCGSMPVPTKHDNLIYLITLYLNTEFEGYPLFDAIVDDTDDKWDIFFNSLYEFVEDLRCH